MRRAGPAEVSGRPVAVRLHEAPCPGGARTVPPEYPSRRRSTGSATPQEARGERSFHPVRRPRAVDSPPTIYPDSGHGGIFRYHERFVAETLEILEG